jgi:hypothetical protein
VSDVPQAASRRAAAAREATAALLTALGCVLLGAPVGLLWGHLTPRLEVVAAGDTVLGPAPTEYFAADAYYLFLGLGAGLLTGLLAVTLGRRHGIGTVLGLAVGGLLAAEVARRTGPLVGREAAQAFLESAQDGSFDLTVRLRALAAMAGWPLAALLAHGVVTAWRVEA